MEIEVKDYSFEQDYMDIKKYVYNGVALLGDDVPEGMLGAKAELVYSKTSVSDMLFELREALKGGEQVETIKEPAAVEPIAVEPEFSANPNDGQEPENFAEQTPSVEELTAKIAELEMTNNSLVEEKNTLAAEIVELKAFKAEVEQKEKQNEIDAVFSKFEDLKEIDGFEALKEKSAEMELVDLETQLYALRGKHNTFAAHVEPETEPQHKDDYTKFILEYSYKTTDEPVWAGLVKKEKE